MPTNLAKLAAGQQAVISGFSDYDARIQRLMALGLLPGTAVQLVRRAPSGDPIEIDVMGDRLSLRSADATRICLNAPAR